MDGTASSKPRWRSYKATLRRPTAEGPAGWSDPSAEFECSWNFCASDDASCACPALLCCCRSPQCCSGWQCRTAVWLAQLRECPRACLTEALPVLPPACSTVALMELPPACSTVALMEPSPGCWLAALPAGLSPACWLAASRELSDPAQPSSAAGLKARSGASSTTAESAVG